MSKADFEAVRQIRNAGREWMADPREITPEDQDEFRHSFIYPVWLYEVNNEIVGYGLVRRGHDRYPYVSLAVASEWRGHGYGAAIYADLRRRWHEDEEICAVIRNDNTPSIRAALAAGFTVTARIVAHDTIVLKATVL